jgi:hypothetical protein
MLGRLNSLNPRMRVSVAEDKKRSEGFRWWEYYAVRYAMGVGLGTALVCLLWRHYHAFFEPTIHIPTPFDSPIAAILWAAIGLTFCYIASVPMLTIHTARVFLRRSSWNRNQWIALAVVLVIPAIAIWGTSPIFGLANTAQKVALLALWIVVSLQGFLIFRVLRSPQDTEKLYDEISAKRPLFPDFVESYRHMREHGNSVSIVLGELLLTYCLWEIHPSATCGPDESAVILYFGLLIAFWLAPSAFVWIVGTRLEEHLTERK